MAIGKASVFRKGLHASNNLVNSLLNDGWRFLESAANSPAPTNPLPNTTEPITYVFDSSWSVPTDTARQATQIAGIHAALATWENVANIDFQRGQNWDVAGYDKNAEVVFHLAPTANILNFGGYSGTAGEATQTTNHTDGTTNLLVAENGRVHTYISNDSWMRGNATTNEPIINGTTGAVSPGGLMLIIHEIGHALGLKHTHDDGADGTPDLTDTNHFLGVTEGMVGTAGTNGLNVTVNSIMSYNNAETTLAGPINNTAAVTTPMAFDIAAIQHLYGANTTFRSGNDTYTLTDASWSCIWDTGGTDEIVYNGSVDAVIDLRPATLDDSRTGGGVPSYLKSTTTSAPTGDTNWATGGFTIAGDILNVLGDVNGVTGVIIENASGGSGNDQITGNDTNNSLRGNRGADTLDGRGGSDVLDGGEGADTMRGGAGDDIYVVDNAGDKVSEMVDIGGWFFPIFLDLGGTDEVRTTLSSYALSTPTGTLENLTYMGSGRFSGTGNSLANTITGRGDIDTLIGEAGNDTIHGGASADVLYGGYRSRAAARDFDGNDVIHGDAGNDVIHVLWGNDVVHGGADIDTLSFSEVRSDLIFSLGVGRVNYTESGSVFDSSGQINGGFAGMYTVTWDGIENIISGSGTDNIVGDANANTLNGGAGNDGLFGGANSDHLTGGLGVDNVYGEAGNDTLVGTYEMTPVYEIMDGGGDTDTADFSSYQKAVWADLDWALPEVQTRDGVDLSTGTWRLVADLNSVENLKGGAAHDEIRGSSGVNRLEGNAGNDTIYGRGAGDTLIGGLGIDKVYGEGGNDSLVATYDMATTNTNYEIMDGGADTDTADFSSFQNAVWLNLEWFWPEAQTRDGVDLSTGTWRILADLNSIENLKGGAAHDEIRGNSGANRLEGNAGNDTIYGGGEADTLIGGLGIDKVYGDAGNDNLVATYDMATTNTNYEIMDGGADTDTADFSSFQNAVWLNLEWFWPEAQTLDGVDLSTGTWRILADLNSIENLRGGAGHDELRGNSGANRLEGNAGRDLLVGGSGIDRLEGGAADDRLEGGLDADTLIGGLNNDVLMGGLGNDTFVFRKGEGADIVSDFGDIAGNEDVIRIEGGAFASFAAMTNAGALKQAGADVVLTLDAATAVTLQNVKLGALDAGDFLFA